MGHLALYLAPSTLSTCLRPIGQTGRLEAPDKILTIHNEADGGQSMKVARSTPCTDGVLTSCLGQGGSRMRKWFCGNGKGGRGGEEQFTDASTELAGTVLVTPNTQKCISFWGGQRVCPGGEQNLGFVGFVGDWLGTSGNRRSPNRVTPTHMAR